MSVEIIIVNWNNRQETLECLAAVEPQARARGNTTVTVVDNGSTDGSASSIAAHHPEVKLFALPENRGFTGGLQTALAGSAADSVIFLNNDAVPEAGWLDALAGALDAAPADVISVGGKIVNLDGSLIDFIGGVLTFDGHGFQSGFRYPIGSHAEPEAGAELLFACGGNMISRRKPLTDLGGFDDDYFAYLEDVDFGWRSWIAGYRVLFEPGAVVRHASSLTSNRLGDFERGVLFERNALQTTLKNFEDLPSSGAAVLLTYLHRLQHYSTQRNERASELTREPFAGRKRNASRTGLLGRVRRRVAGAPPLATIDDPLTTMQFRALDWVLRNGDRIAEKRRLVQSSRKRPDREIFARFPLHVVPTYPGDAALMSSPLFDLFRPDLPSVEKNLADLIRS